VSTSILLTACTVDSQNAVAEDPASSSKNALERMDAANGAFGYQSPRALAVAIAVLKEDPNPDYRYSAAEELYGVNAPEAVAALISAMNDTDRKIRAEAIFSLGHSTNPDAISAMIELLESRDAADREAAAGLLSEGSDYRAVEPLLKVAQNPREEEAIRRAAIIGLGHLRDPRATGPLIEILDNPQSDDGGRFSLRVGAAEALAKIGDPQGVNAVLAMAHRRDWKLIDRISAALIMIGDPSTVDLLIDTLKETNESDIAQELLNSGNAKLEAVARQWAAAHRIKISEMVTPYPAAYSWGDAGH
jgi:HEAT repeat protein